MSNVRTCKEDWSEDQNTDTGALEDMQTTPMLHVGACQREKYLHYEPKQATVHLVRIEAKQIRLPLITCN